MCPAPPLRVLAAALALVLAAAQGAAAQEKDADARRFSRSGPYIGVGFAISQEQFTHITRPNPAGPVPPEITFDPGFGFDPALGYSVRAGYRINDFVATDFFFRQTFDSNLGVTRTDPVPGSPGMTVTRMFTPDGELLTATPGIRLYPVGHLDWRFQPSGFVQIGYMFGDVPTLDTTVKGFAVRAGVGLESYITEHIAFVVDFAYIVGAGDTSKLDHLGYDFGLVYRF